MSSKSLAGYAAGWPLKISQLKCVWGNVPVFRIVWSLEGMHLLSGGQHIYPLKVSFVENKTH